MVFEEEVVLVGDETLDLTLAAMPHRKGRGVDRVGPWVIMRYLSAGCSKKGRFALSRTPPSARPINCF